MKSYNANMVTQKNKQTNQPVFLYKVYDYDGLGTHLFFTQHDSSITYKGDEYQPFPIQHDYVSENSNHEVDGLSIRIGNVSRQIQSYLENYEFRGKQVDIMLAWTDQLSDPDAYGRSVFFIDHWKANQSDVEFILTTKFDLVQADVPHRKFTRSYCQWKFKGTECGYVGAESECNKTKDDCKNNKDNYSRFGGFPSIPSRRFFIS